MNKKELRKVGTAIVKYELYDNLYKDAFDGYREIIYYNNRLFCIEEHRNSLSYNGKNNTSCFCDNVRKDLEEYNFRWWGQLLDKESFNYLKEVIKKEDNKQ